MIKFKIPDGEFFNCIFIQLFSLVALSLVTVAFSKARKQEPTKFNFSSYPQSFSPNLFYLQRFYVECKLNTIQDIFGINEFKKNLY